MSKENVEYIFLDEYALVIYKFVEHDNEFVDIYKKTDNYGILKKLKEADNLDWVDFGRNMRTETIEEGNEFRDYLKTRVWGNTYKEFLNNLEKYTNEEVQKEVALFGDELVTMPKGFLDYIIFILSIYIVEDEVEKEVIKRGLELTEGYGEKI